MIIVPDSDRLTFGLIQDNEPELLYELEKDPEVMKYLTGGKTSTLQQVIDTAIPRLRSFRNPEKGWGLWKVNDIRSGEYYGWILIRPLHFMIDDVTQENNLEIGWRFTRASWGKGYATEAAKAVMEAIKQQTDVTHFHAVADPQNKGSISIMKKLGMVYIKTFLHKDPLGDSEAVYFESKCP